MTEILDLTEISRSSEQIVPACELSQDELHERYQEQQQRLACPSCGEDPFLG
jgi:hypothetical protein